MASATAAALFGAGAAPEARGQGIRTGVVGRAQRPVGRPRSSDPLDGEWGRAKPGREAETTPAVGRIRSRPQGGAVPPSPLLLSLVRDPADRLVRPLEIVGAACQAERVELTTADLDKIRAENLHVRRDDFVRVWTAVEEHQDAQLVRGVADWYGEGVRTVCRWLAIATVRPASGPWHMARSPITERTDWAYPELIQAEAIAADLLLWRRPVPQWLTKRPGWAEAIVTTLEWTWRYSGRPPVFGDHRAAS